MDNFVLDEDMAYFVGALIGDGHISNAVKSKMKDLSPDYRIVFDVSDVSLANELMKILNILIITKSIPFNSSIKKNRLHRKTVQVRNKKLFLYLTEELKVPKGAKSSIVFVPSQIKSSSFLIKKHFIAGYFDTDGGLRGGTLGFTSASKQMINDVSILLTDFFILHSVDRWINKNNYREYYGIRLLKNQTDKFLNKFPFRNKDKLNKIVRHFHVGMPERSNGTDD